MKLAECIKLVKEKSLINGELEEKLKGFAGMILQFNKTLTFSVETLSKVDITIQMFLMAYSLHSVADTQKVSKNLH